MKAVYSLSDMPSTRRSYRTNINDATILTISNEIEGRSLHVNLVDNLTEHASATLNIMAELIHHYLSSTTLSTLSPIEIHWYPSSPHF